MGVAMPPMSVPLDTAQVRVCRSMPKVSARDRSTGTITVAMGILSTKADTMAVNQIKTTTIWSAWSPPSAAKNWAIPSKTPVCSSPLTVRNRPMIKPRIFQSICLTRFWGVLVLTSVTAAASTPMVGMVSPVKVWVAMSKITTPKIETRAKNLRRLGMASLGSISQSSGATAASPLLLLRKQR